MHSWRIFGQVQSGYNIGGGGGEKLGGAHCLIRNVTEEVSADD